MTASAIAGGDRDLAQLLAQISGQTDPQRRIALLHGVNLNQLGKRDPAHYGTLTLAELERQVTIWAGREGIEVDCFSTNFEGAFVEKLHSLRGQVGGVIVNPGAWTHYSYAIHDALEVLGLPTVEVHLSDIDSREAWRQHSVIRPQCFATVSGKGVDGYREALELLRKELTK